MSISCKSCFIESVKNDRRFGLHIAGHNYLTSVFRTPGAAQAICHLIKKGQRNYLKRGFFKAGHFRLFTNSLFSRYH